MHANERMLDLLP